MAKDLSDESVLDMLGGVCTWWQASRVNVGLPSCPCCAWVKPREVVVIREHAYFLSNRRVSIHAAASSRVIGRRCLWHTHCRQAINQLGGPAFQVQKMWTELLVAVGYGKLTHSSVSWAEGARFAKTLAFNLLLPAATTSGQPGDELEYDDGNRICLANIFYQANSAIAQKLNIAGQSTCLVQTIP